MGSGKSTMAINHINANQNKKFLCIVPLLKECKRYEEKTNIDIIDPEKWGSKWKHFRWLIENDKNIVTTHALIQKMDLDMLELLKSKDYSLMIDECLDVLNTYKISKDDLKIIFNEKLVSLDDDGFLIWNEDKKPYKGVYGDIKRLCSFKSLMGFKKDNSDELARILMWNFPVDFFKCFEESYIFTYLWDGSIQKSYFDIHGIQYEKYMLNENKELIPHNRLLEYKKRKKAVDLINIYDGKFNSIGMKIGKSNPLSKSWYEDKRKKNLSIFNQLKNEFREKKSLAYLINFFMQPDIKQFIDHYHIEFDEDLFSLSALLQWIWRSQIRDGRPVDIYIPSERMRTLLKVWMKECKALENIA